jgi:hypothetical protein
MDDDDDIEPAGRRRLAEQACWSVEGEVREGQGGEGEGAFICRDGSGVARLAACQLRPSTVGAGLARELPAASGTERSKWGGGSGSRCAGLVAVNVTQRAGRGGGRAQFLLTGAIRLCGAAASGTESDRE